MNGVAVCSASKNFILPGLTDSKKLTEKREQFYSYIVEHCLAYGVGIVSADEIDKINIYQATKRQCC